MKSLEIKLLIGLGLGLVIALSVLLWISTRSDEDHPTRPSSVLVPLRTSPSP